MPDLTNDGNQFTDFSDINDLDHLFGDGDIGNASSSDDKAGAGQSKTSASKDQNLDVDSFFGGPAFKDPEPPQSKTNTNNNDSNTADSDDDSFTGLSHEQVIKKLQSIKDKAKQRVKQLESELEEVRPIKEVYNKIIADPIVRRAFIAELEPELIKPNNPYDTVRQHLAEKFGADFIPDKDEATIPFTPSWEYIREANEMLKKLESEGGTVKKTLQQIRQEQAELAKKQQQQLAEFKEKMKTKYKWTDETFEQFQRWGSKVGLDDLGVYFDFLMKKASQKNQAKTPNLAGVRGGSNLPNEVKAELDKFFG